MGTIAPRFIAYLAITKLPNFATLFRNLKFAILDIVKLSLNRRKRK